MRMRSLLVLATIVTSVLALQCKKSDSSSGTAPSTGSVPTQLVGTWKFQSVTLNGAPGDLAQVLEFVTGAVKAEVVIGSDGSYTYRERNASDAVLYTSAGTITVQGQTATVRITSENGQPLSTPETLTQTWAVAGTTLTLTTVVTVQGQQVTVVFTLTK